MPRTATPTKTATRARSATEPTAASEVTLVGRIGQHTQEVELPSGDVMTRFDIVIDRPPRDRVGRTRVDTIACVTTTATVAKRVSGLQPGDWVMAEGVLRRRFWRAGASLGSAMEVDVRRLVRA